MKTIIRLFSKCFGFLNKAKTILESISDADISDPDETWFTNDAARQKYGRIVSLRPEEVQVSKMRDLGFKPCGSGSFASVFLVDEETVVKVSKCPDKPYKAFLRLALRRQGNPFYPRVFAVGFHGNEHVVIMERLQALKEGKSFWHLLWKTRDEPAQLPKLLFYKPVREAFKENRRAFREVVRDIKKLCVKYRYDLHGKNVMYRGHQLVVIDPIYKD